MTDEEFLGHPVFRHPNGNTCIWLDGDGWFVPLDVGGEGYSCEEVHPQDAAVTVLEELVKLKDGPRDEAYEARKPWVWEAARIALRKMGRVV